MIFPYNIWLFLESGRCFSVILRPLYYWDWSNSTISFRLLLVKPLSPWLEQSALVAGICMELTTELVHRISYKNPCVSESELGIQWWKGLGLYRFRKPLCGMVCTWQEQGAKVAISLLGLVLVHCFCNILRNSPNKWTDVEQFSNDFKPALWRWVNRCLGMSPELFLCSSRAMYMDTKIAISKTFGNLVELWYWIFSHTELTLGALPASLGAKVLLQVGKYCHGGFWDAVWWSHQPILKLITICADSINPLNVCGKWAKKDPWVFM